MGPGLAIEVNKTLCSWKCLYSVTRRFIRQEFMSLWLNYSFEMWRCSSLIIRYAVEYVANLVSRELMCARKLFPTPQPDHNIDTKQDESEEQNKNPSSFSFVT